MNLGLGNLATLKSFVLTKALEDATAYDTTLQAIGKGVATLMEHHCNRYFTRVAGSVDTFSADRSAWWLSRFPVESIAALELKSSDAEGWVAQQGAIDQSEYERGYIEFGGAYLGDSRTRVRVTYTGGYWFDALEPSDEGFPSVQPEGTSPVPDDLRLAWLMQCQHVFEAKDKTLPKGIAADGTPIPMNLKDVVLLNQVVDILRPYVRYQMI